MRISLNWLTDYVDVTLPAKELGELFTRIGLNCDAIEEVGSDIVFTLDVTSNRPDWLGHLGVARELAAATGAAFKPPRGADTLSASVAGASPARSKASDLARVEVQEPVLCPRYTARILRGVKVGKSPGWLVERLEAMGLRSINNVVDVTNFVLFEYSQPLHSFDYDKLAEHRIVVRRAKDGETMTAIDGSRCRLESSMLVIADAQKPVAIAGIMGGLDSEVSATTTNILLESAQFDPLTTRRASRKLGLMSPSNYRFERGIDPVGIDRASLRACQMILELAGGTLAEGMVDVWANPYTAPVVSLRPERTDQILGFHIDAARQAEILAGLGLTPRTEVGKIICTIPPHRRDLSREIDLIEEVARLQGYDKLPTGSHVTHEVRAEGLPQRTRRRVGEVLSAAGFDEAMTFTFIDAPEAALFGCPEPLQADPVVRKTNNAVRPSLLPSLLRACKSNQDAGNAGVSLFELSAVFPPGAPGELPDEHVDIGLVTSRDLRELRGAIEAIVQAIAPQSKLDVRPESVAGLTAGASARLLLDGQDVGVLGRVATKVKDYYGLEHDLWGGTISFDALLKNAGAVRRYQELPRFPGVERDLSLIVDEAVTWQDLLAVLQSVEQALRVGIDYVTTYRGKPIESGRKSVTVKLTYRSPEGTLRSEQVDEQVVQVVRAAQQTLKAELRT